MTLERADEPREKGACPLSCATNDNRSEAGMQDGQYREPAGPERSPLQLAALLVGIAFLLVGIAGFIPGITTNFRDMDFASDESKAEIFGIFQTSVLHNIVHLLFGVLGLAMSRTWGAARTFLLGGGLVYLVLWIYGLVIDEDSTANFVPFDEKDNWLHLGLGLAMLGLGLLLGRRRADVDRARPVAEEGVVETRPIEQVGSRRTR